MRRIAVLSLGNFFAAAHFFLIIYILAPYLATLMPAAVSGLAISLGAVITLTVFPFIPKLVRRHGPQRLGIAFAALEGAILLGLALNPMPLMAVFLAALACATSPFIGYQLDLLLEDAVTDEGTTGRIRTVFLTAGNTALVIAPIVTGYLLNDSDRYGIVFLVAALTLIPFIVLMARQRLPHPENPPTRTDVRSAYRHIMQDPDLRAIAFANVVMQQIGRAHV